jgi:hypothetical protein
MTTFRDQDPSTPITATWLNAVDAAAFTTLPAAAAAAAAAAATAQAAVSAQAAFVADLASPAAGKGAGLVKLTTGRTVESKLKEFSSAADAGAPGDGSDQTSSLNAAAAAAAYIYLPAGDYRSTNVALEYWRFFGIGTLRVGTQNIEVPPFPQSGAAGKFYRTTFGNYESAVALTVVADGLDQSSTNTQVTGTSAAGVASSYQSFDHVGLYVAGNGYACLKTAGGTTTFTATSVSAPDITTASVKVGMFAWVQGGAGYVGKVTSVAAGVATVDSWYTWGSGAPATPANAQTCWFNPNTKIWPINANLYLPTTGDANAGTGFELGLVVNKVGAGANVRGFEAVSLGSEKPFAMFAGRNARTATFYSDTGGDFGFLAAAPAVGFEVRDATAYSYSVNNAAGRRWSVDPAGCISRQHLAITVDGITAETSVCISTAGGTPSRTLPAGLGAGRTITVKALNACTVSAASAVVDGVASVSLGAGTWGTFICDGTNWYRIG